MELKDGFEKRYVESGGIECPVCHCQNVSAGPIEADGSTAYSNVECKGCGSTWTDIYKLVSVDNVEATR